MGNQLVGYLGRRADIYGCLFFAERQHSLGVPISARMDMAVALLNQRLHEMADERS